MRLGAAAVAAASQSAESRDPPAGRLRKAWRILRMLYRNDVTRYTVCKVTEGVSGVSGHAADFLLFAKERQLVQVVVSPYTYPTFVLSVAVVLLVSC